jgi:hypothetical protein
MSAPRHDAEAVRQRSRLELTDVYATVSQRFWAFRNDILPIAQVRRGNLGSRALQKDLAFWAVRSGIRGCCCTAIFALES